MGHRQCRAQRWTIFWTGSQSRFSGCKPSAFLIPGPDNLLKFYLTPVGISEALAMVILNISKLRRVTETILNLVHLNQSADFTLAFWLIQISRKRQSPPDDIFREILQIRRVCLNQVTNFRLKELVDIECAIIDLHLQKGFNINTHLATPPEAPTPRRTVVGEWYPLAAFLTWRLK